MTKPITDLVIPDVGDTDSIELVKWNKKAGESFEKGDELCDLVTDKASFSLEAPEKGILHEILIPEGNIVKVHQLAARVICK
ncbi:MAG: lipoyl domain-containing protein [Spirochaetia bacterium]|nr:lipoyl domain-containing protein [Spirochaetia bacterium]